MTWPWRISVPSTFSSSARLIDRRGAEAQARDAFGYARVVLNFAVEQGMLAVSPLAGVKFGRPAKPRERYLSVWEIRLFWTKLDTTPMHDHYKTIMRLQLLLGRRVSEVAGMAREEINMDARIWTIPAERCKNAVELRVPLTKMAREIIKKYLRSTAGRLLFPNSLGNPHDAKHIANALLAAQDHFGFTTITGEPNKFTTHDLRRTCGTLLTPPQGPGRCARGRVGPHAEGDGHGSALQPR